MAQLQHIKNVTEFHRNRNLPEPEHPLISVINYADLVTNEDHIGVSWVYDFYSISLKRNIGGKIKYGQREYDFDEGVMFFIAPGQVFSINREAGTSPNKEGWMLLIHPDFLWNTPLAKKMQQYAYFDYEVNEALFLSKKEEDTLMGIIKNITNEYHTTIDAFSQQIIISQLETLFNYSERFYQRQFLTRKMENHQVLERFEHILNTYFLQEDVAGKGLPTVAYMANQLHLSQSYLSSLLKQHTGQNAQQHIHQRVIALAKEKLSTTNLSVSEIAYQLGFEYPQSFSKLFKKKTEQSPLAFRQSFN